MTKKILYNIIFLALFVSTTRAERFKNCISGQIIDAETGAPVYYVNIFLANTTIGTTSNTEGRYQISNVPPGNYTLVISHISYETVTQKVMLNSSSKSILNFAISPTVIEMSPLYIDEERDRTWRKYFKIFEKEFLGYSDNAQACQFINPEVLHLVQGENPETLYGKTIQPLELVHANFGYRIKLIVRSFRITEDKITYTVLPVFEEMPSASEAQAALWEKNREQAFYGSFRHFFNTLFRQQFRQAGFSVERVQEEKRFRASTEQYDSQSAEGRIFLHTDYGLIKRLFFPDYLRIRYKENWAQTSFLRLPFDTMEVDLSGNALSDFQIIRSGYWGEKRFADELPLDYRP
ncbi:carboxypeptidase-like regulatory domain-containing protein [candidate division KSB1 bacterium]|nr:carboxypeptidase-like regulatory domain-containing protein [candidate division KSB1 bacterium]